LISIDCGPFCANRFDRLRSEMDSHVPLGCFANGIIELCVREPDGLWMVAWGSRRVR